MLALSESRCKGGPLASTVAFVAPIAPVAVDPNDRGGSIVEAFPNAFLGVLIPEIDLLSAPKLKRGRRFD
jgi:hypothetical protein